MQKCFCFCCHSDFIPNAIQKSIYFASEQYVYAVECWLYYALPPVYLQHKQLLIAAGVSAIALVIPVMIRKMRFLRRLTWVYAGIGIILLAAVFALARTSYGAKLSLLGVQPSEAIKITFCVLYGIFSIQRYQFQGNRSGYSRCSTSRGYSGSLKGPWKCSDLLCRISRYGICCNTKCWLSCTWNRRWFSCSSCCISSVRSCPPASQRMERSYGSLSE